MNCRAKRAEFINRFKEKYGEVTCRGLLGFDLTTEEGHEEYLRVFADKAAAPCTKMVHDAAMILEDLGY
jgi:hypothetical protein